MPLMQSIRKNAKVVLYIMAAAFLLWIFLELGMNIAGINPGGQKVFQQGIIAEIDGQKVNLDYFRDIYNEILQKETEKKGELSERDIQRLENLAWKELLFRVRFEKIKRERGIIIDQFLLNAIISTLPPPEILEDKSFWKGDSFDIKKYQEFLQKPESRDIIVKYMIELLHSYPIEIMNMDIINTIHLTKEEIQKELERDLTKFTFDFIFIKHGKIKDDIFKINEDSLLKFYEKNKKDYIKKPTCSLEYVYIPKLPSKEDTTAVLETAKEVANIIREGEISFEEAIGVYSEIKKFKKDTIFVFNKDTKKYEKLNHYREDQITDPIIFNDTVFIFKIINKDKKKIKAKAISFLIKASFDTKMQIREKVRKIYEEITKKGFKKVCDSLGLEIIETREFPITLPVIPGIGEIKEMLEWIKKAKKGEINFFRIPQGYFIARIKEKKGEELQKFEDIKESIKFRYLIEKKKKYAKKLASDILEGKQVKEDFIEKKEFKEVYFLKIPPGLPSPRKIFSLLHLMEIGEKKTVEVPGGIAIVHLKDKRLPTTEEIQEKLIQKLTFYHQDLQKKLATSFNKELTKEEGVKDYRKELLE